MRVASACLKVGGGTLLEAVLPWLLPNRRSKVSRAAVLTALGPSPSRELDSPIKFLADRVCHVDCCFTLSSSPSSLFDCSPTYPCMGKHVVHCTLLSIAFCMLALQLKLARHAPKA